MTELHLLIPGEAVGKAYKSHVVGGFAKPYVDTKCKAYIKRVSGIAREAVFQQGWTPPEPPATVRVSITAYIAMPRAWPKKRKLESQGRHALHKPDLDNLEKSIWDGMVGMKTGPRTYEGIVIADDDQIAACTAERIWCWPGEERVEAYVRLTEQMAFPTLAVS